MTAPAPVLVDFESRSRCDLKKRGGRNYWADPSSEVLCAVLYDTASGEVSAWAPGMPVPNLALAVAHNATNFDRFAAEASGWRVEGWLDSSQAARRAGLPGALDALAQRWLGRPKDKAGSKLTQGLSRPSRAKKTFGQLPEITPAIRDRVLEYCADDVQVMAEAWPRLSPWLEVDAATAEVDRAINDRGIYLDQELVQGMLALIARDQERAVERAAKALGWSSEATRAAAMSPAQFCQATGLPNAQKDELDRIAKAQGSAAHPLIAVRRALASIVPGKLRAALERVSPDSRLRDSHLYYGAHTGRWSSKGMQHHNLPRVGFEEAAHDLGVDVSDYIDALVDGVLTGADLTKKQFDGLMRAVLTAAPGRALCVLDYSGIEARALAWAANDRKALDVFRAKDAGAGPDPYKVMAATIFHVDTGAVTKDQRSVGKAAELGCGYGMGPSKFDGTCEKAGVNLVAFGVDAEDVVQAWRKLHAPIVRLWRDCEAAYAAACEGRSGRAGPFTYEPIGDDVACVLPSQRPVMYPGARAKRGRRGWDLSYRGHLFEEHVYGGLLVENAIQAMCRDFLADALGRCELDGLDPVLHVHDEAVCEVDADVADEGLEHMRMIMADVPEWARGLPIVLDGFVSRRYRK